MAQGTITITFGDQAENHVGMQKLGQLADHGFSLEDLNRAKTAFEKLGCSCELIYLNDLLNPHLTDPPSAVEPDDAYILVVRRGVDAMLSQIPSRAKLFKPSELKPSPRSDDLFAEQIALEWDTQAFMKGRVVNKRARYNLCYADQPQEPDYENKKGRLVAFDQIPLTKFIRENLSNYLGEVARNLMAEGNLYYDSSACFIGFHGDAERRKVVAIRLGDSMPLNYQWYLKGDQVGPRIKLILNHGDLYVMSEKAVGTDWLKRNTYTLRHSAGSDKALGIK